MQEDYHSEGNTPQFDPDKIRREIEQLQQGGALARSFEIKTDKDGKSRWLGMALSPEVAAGLQYAFSMAQPIINKQGGEFLYHKVKDAVGSQFVKNWVWKPDPVTPHKAGLAAAKLFMGAIIAAQPIDQLMHVRRNNSNKRKELFKDLEPVIQIDKGAYKNNTVIRMALGRIHDEMMTGLKKAAADIPTVGLATLFAARDYKSMRDRKDHEFTSHVKIQQTAHDAHAEYEKLWDAEAERIQKAIDAKRNAGMESNALERYEEMAWEDFRKRQQGAPQFQEETHSNSDTPLMAGAGFGSFILRSKVGKSEQKTIAWDLIKQLREENENSTVPDLVDHIAEIFQQNERDQGHPVIGNKLMPGLRPAIERIARAIEEEGLDPLALVNLVGGGKIVQHVNGERRFTKVEQVEELIREQLKVLHTAEVITPDEFFTNFANPMFVQQTLKKGLAEMPEMQRAMVAAMFPPEVLEKMGYDKETTAKLQKQGHEQMYFLVGSIVMDLATRSPEKLQKLGLDENDIQSIRDLSEKIDLGDLQALKVAVDGRDKHVLAAARTAALTEQAETGKDPWTSRIQSAGDIRQKLETAAAEKVAAEKTQKSDVQKDALVEKAKPEDSAVGRELKRRDNEPDYVLGA